MYSGSTIWSSEIASYFSHIHKVRAVVRRSASITLSVTKGMNVELFLLRSLPGPPTRYMSWPSTANSSLSLKLQMAGFKDTCSS